MVFGATSLVAAWSFREVGVSDRETGKATGLTGTRKAIGT